MGTRLLVLFVFFVLALILTFIIKDKGLKAIPVVFSVLSGYGLFLVILAMYRGFGIPLDISNNINEIIYSPFSNGKTYVKTFETKKDSMYLFMMKEISFDGKEKNFNEIFTSKEQISDTSVYTDGKFVKITK